MKLSSWRFIDYSEHSGSLNMAIDEAILESHLKGSVPPTLRVYDFAPPAVSLGFTQKPPQGLLERAQAQGLQVVKRPTGGRAVLHLGDLTYSFVASSLDDSSYTTDFTFALEKGVAAAYRQICQGLIQAFCTLGVELQLGTSANDYRTLHDCFGAVTQGDLQYRGKKIIGSAQLRRKHAVLQHGSILLDQGQNAMSLLLLGSEQNNLSRHANLFEILDPMPKPKLAQIIKQGFEKAFSQTFDDSDLSQDEIALAQLLEQKYKLACETLTG